MYIIIAYPAAAQHTAEAQHTAAAQHNAASSAAALSIVVSTPMLNNNKKDARAETCSYIIVVCYVRKCCISNSSLADVVYIELYIELNLYGYIILQFFYFKCKFVFYLRLNLLYTQPNPLPTLQCKCFEEGFLFHDSAFGIQHKYSV